MADLNFRAVLQLASKPFVSGANAASAALGKLTGKSQQTRHAFRDAGRAGAGASSATRAVGAAAQVAAQALRNAGGGAQQAASGLRKAKKEAADAAQQLSKAQQAAKQSTTTFQQLKKVAGGVAIAATARKFVGSVNAYQQLQNRLRTVTNTEAERGRLYKELFAISQRTYGSLAATGQSFQRLSKAADRLGRSQSEMLQVQETLNQAIVVGGSNAVESAAGMVQFTQGLASGRLQGDELKSVLEGLPGVTDALIDGLQKTGAIAGEISRGTLREMAAAGQLAADVLIDALLAAADDVDKKFQGLAPTLVQGFTTLRNAALDSSGAFAKFGDAGARSMISLANNFAIVEAAAIATATVVGGRLTAALGRFAIARAGKIHQAFADARAEAAVAQAHLATSVAATRATAATTALATARVAARGALALLGGPVGAIATALTAGAAAWTLWGNKAKDAVTETETALERAQLLIERFAQNSSVVTATQTQQGIKGLETELEQKQAALRGRLARLNSLGFDEDSPHRNPKGRVEKELAARRDEITDLEEHLQKLKGIKAQIQDEQEQQKQQRITAADAAEGLQLETTLTQRLAKARQSAALVGLQGQERTDTVRDQALQNIKRETQALTEKIKALKLEESQQQNLLNIVTQISKQQTTAAKKTHTSATAGRVTADTKARTGRIQRYQEAADAARNRTALVGASPEDRVALEAAQARQRIQAEYDKAIQGLQENVAAHKQEIEAAADLRDEKLAEVDAQEKQSKGGPNQAIAKAQNDARRGLTELISLSEAGAATGVIAAEGLGNAFAAAFTQSKEAARDFVKSTLSQVAQLAAQQVVLRSLGLGAPVKHSGGVVGLGGANRQVPPWLFANAPRLHGGGIAGLRSGEVPAILERGEEVLTRNDPRHVLNQGRGAIEVREQVVNNTPAQASPSAQQNANGGVDVRVELDRALAAILQQPGGSRAQAALARLGVKPKLQGR